MRSFLLILTRPTEMNPTSRAKVGLKNSYAYKPYKFKENELQRILKIN